MTTQELMKVKEYQRDFEEKFGKKLYISWAEMKGVLPRIAIAEMYEEPETINEVTPEEILDEIVMKHGTTVEAIRDRSRRVNAEMKERERNALIEFSRIIVKNRIKRGYAAKLINRDRTLLYHFAKLDYA